MLRDHLSVRPSICLVITVFLELHFYPLGVDGVNQASKEGGTDILASEGSIVHKNCQHRYTDKKDIAKRKSSIAGESTFVRGCQSNLQWEKTFLFFCDRTVSFDKPKDGSRLDASKLQTDDFVQTVSACAAQRCEEWSYKAKGRIEYFSSDLHAADAVYHRSCRSNFRTGKQIPLKYNGGSNEKQKAGRPENPIQQNAFLDTCSYFENNDEEQLTLSDLIGKMDEFLQDTEYYSTVHETKTFRFLWT